MEETIPNVTRRRLLALLSATAAAHACKGSTPVFTADPTPTIEPPPSQDSFGLDAWFEALEIIQQGVRSSPDHRVAEAERLIAAADAAGLHQLVQQQVRLVPVSDGALVDFSVEIMHWGPDNALRCGAGTARAKAELLKSLLERAGFESSLYRYFNTLDSAKVTEMLTTGVDAPFDPQFTDEQIDFLAMGPAFEADERLDSPTDVQVTALADALDAQIPWSDNPAWIGASTSDYLPLVKAIIDGEEVWLDPIDPSAAYGEFTGATTPSLLEAPPVLPEVEVALLWTRAENSGQEEVLVEQTWSADQVAGRTLSANFAPVAGMDELLYAPVSGHRVWSPVLSFSNRETEEDVVRGESFSVRGEAVEIDLDAGTVTWDGTPIDLDGDATLAATVARVEMSVQPGSWPEVGLRVAAFDAAGDPVVGLGSPQFELTEEGQELRPAVTGNSRTTRRIFVVIDQSASVDEAFRGPGAAAIVGQLFDDLDTTDVEWAVGGVRPTVVPEGDFTSVRAEVIAQAEASASTSGNSNLWGAVVDAARYEVDAIVLLSDGESGDLEADVDAAELADCPPVITVQVTGGAPDGSMAALAELTGGVLVDLDDTLAGLDAISEALTSPLDVFYALTFASPQDGPVSRTVQLQVGAAPMVEVTYEVPATSTVRPPTPVSLRLRVRVGDRTVTRVLAGLPIAAGRVNDPEQLAEAAAQVRLGLAHGASLTFDGPAPPLAQTIDDQVEERLASRPVLEWLRTSDLDTLPDALDATTMPRPRAAQVLLHTLIDPTSTGVPSYPLGLTAVLQRSERRFISDTEVEVIATTDVLPLTPWHAHGPTAEASRRATLEHSIRLALLEGALPGDSTDTLLDGVALVPLDRFQGIGQVVSGLDEATLDAWEETLDATRSRYVHLVPADGVHRAAWAIDAETGALIGLIPGGAGGSSARSIHEFLEAMMGIAAFSGTLLGVSAATAGFAAYIVFQIRMWGIATACMGSLFTGAPQGVDEQRLRDELNEMLCNIVKAFAIGPVMTIDLALGLYDALAGVYGSKGICGLIVDLD